MAKRLTGPFLQHLLQQFNDGQIDRAEAAALLRISEAHLYRLHTRWLQNRAAFSARLSGGSHRPAWPPAACQFLKKIVPLQTPPNFQLVADELASRFGFKRHRQSVAAFVRSHFPNLIGQPAPRTKTRRRWERARLGELWQHDSSIHQWWPAPDKQTLLLTVDDHSRKLLGAVFVRMTGVHRTTIQKLLVELGAACSAYQDKTFRNLNCKRIQCDEIWSFVGCKEKNVTADNRSNGWGSVWTWVALDSATKLVPCWFVGTRDADAANHFIHDLAGRLAHRIQLTTDGHKPYLNAVEDAFGADIDYATLVKIYGTAPEGGEVRYSPAQCIGARKAAITGSPDKAHISTSHMERQNLTMRMSMRRFMRLTNAFSKKIENHEAAIALHYMHYNFARVHQTLRVTPAMEAGISNHVWTLEEIVGLID